jgi:hypothetical protein
MVLVLGKGRRLRRGVKVTLRGVLRVTMHLIVLASPLRFVGHLPPQQQRQQQRQQPDQWE